MSFVSLHFHYQKYGIKVLFYILGTFFLFPAIMFIIYGNISFVIFLIIASIFLCLAIFLSTKSQSTKKVNKNGTGGHLGEIIQNTDRTHFVFYYKLEDGRIGETSQKIKSDIFEKLKDKKVVPIKIYQHQAVVDEDLIKQTNPDDLPKEELHISEEIAKIEDKFHIGNLAHGLIWYFFAFISVFVPVVLVVYGTSSLLNGMLLAPMIIFLVLNPFTVVFFVIGAVVSRNNYYAPKIAFETNKKDKDEAFEKVKGTVVPLVNTVTKYEKFNKGSKIAIVYQDEEGKYHKTIQSISGIKRADLNDNNSDEITVYRWHRENGKYVGVLGTEKLPLIKKIINRIKEWNIPFYAMLAVNLYFFVMELISVIGSNFTSGLSNFGAIVYFMTIIYVVGMFLLEKLNKSENGGKNIYYAYAVTVIFLTLNLAVLPGLYAFGSFNENVNFLVVIQGFFNTVFASILTTFIYLAYLFIKFIRSIMQAHQAKELGEHYDRCLSFGDTISGLYAAMVFGAHALVTMFYLGNEGATIITFQESRPVQIIFIVMLIAMSFFDLLFLIQCAVQMRRVRKAKKKEPMALENKE